MPVDIADGSSSHSSQQQHRNTSTSSSKQHSNRSNTPIQTDSNRTSSSQSTRKKVASTTIDNWTTSLLNNIPNPGKYD